MNRTTDNANHPTQESLNFLKSVVNQEEEDHHDLNAVKNGTDSDKENEHTDLFGTSSAIGTASTSSTSSSTSGGATKEFIFNLQSSSTTDSIINSKTQHIQNNNNNNNSSNSTMSKGDSDMWDDFYNAEEFESMKNDGDSRSNANNEFDILRPDRRLDKVEEEEEDEIDEGDDDDQDYGENSNATTGSLSKKERVRVDKGDEDKNNGSRGSSKKRKKQRLFKRRAPPPLSPKSRTLLPIGGSHPNISDSNNKHRNGSVSSGTHDYETMSDTTPAGSYGGGGHQQRKLLRRKQVSRPRCAGPKPDGDPLQQKYQELEHLMLKPLPNPAVYVQQTRQQMLRLQGLNATQNNNHHQQQQPHHPHPAGLPPTGQQQHAVPRDSEKTDRVIQIIDEDTNQVYSTMMTVNANRNGINIRNKNNRPNSALPNRRRPTSGRNQQRQRPRPQSAGHARSSATNSSSAEQSSSSALNSTSNSVNGGNSNHSFRGRKPFANRGNRESGGNSNNRRAARSDSSASEGSSRHRRSDRSESESRDRAKGGYRSSSFEDGTDSRSGSRSPDRTTIQTTDNHIKNSANPALRQWLKVKDKEHRQQKREERKKKSKERAEKQEEEDKKQEHLKVAEKKVKEWMTQKRKEAWRQAKEERKRRKEEEKEIEQQIRHTESLRGKMFTPIQRPAGKYESNNNKSPEQQQESNNALHTTTPHPPKSKFVYKRPVSGRVRLMKLQQERKEDSKKVEEKKKEMDEALSQENERKMRMSYDQWLLKKREDDYAKRRDAAKQRALARSDPELDRIVPEMARRRIENIKRGKKRIDTGESSINKSVNKSFGGGDFGEGEGKKEDGEKRPSYGLEVSGDKKSLKQRPSSAKHTNNASNGINPKMSRSPRRPQSANPRVQALMDESDDSSLNTDNSFKLPFPPELGVPKYVAARQEKLFSDQVIDSAKSNASGTGPGDSQVVPAAVTKGGGGGEGKTSPSGNGRASVKTNGAADEVDAEEEFEPQLKTVAESVIASKSDHEGEGVEDQSFFVTHGNIKKNNDDDDGDEENQVDDNNDIDADDNKEDKLPNDFISNSEEGSIENESEIKNDDDFFDVDQKTGINEEDGGDVVPPLNIGNDEGDEIKYEEEEEMKDEDGKMMDDEEEEENGTAPLPESSSSNLLSHVEQVSESVEVKSSIKHVSFSDETTVHEDPLAGISNEGDDYGDDDDDDFYNNYSQFQQPMMEQDDNGDGWKPRPVGEGEDFDLYEDLDEIEGQGFKDDDDEAEDERGGHFDDETPRDDF